MATQNNLYLHEEVMLVVYRAEAEKIKLKAKGPKRR